MGSAKEKLSNMASSAKENVNIYKAKVEEKVEKATARTEEEKKIAEERRKAKEGEAKRELHEAKARHAAEKLSHKQVHHHSQPPLLAGTATTTAATAGPHYGQNDNQPVGTAHPMAGTTVPTYPVGTHLPRNKHL